MKLTYFSTILFLCFNFYGLKAEVPQLTSEQVFLNCEDQAENYGNGKSDDVVSKECLSLFKKAASSKAIKESKINKFKIYGYRNMLIIEQSKNNSVTTELIAGSSTELDQIEALDIDETHQEAIVLLANGNILFFTTKMTGNLAPYRILKGADIIGSNEIIYDSARDLIALNNPKNKKVLFYKRLANIHAPKERRNLDNVKALDTKKYNLKNISIDSTTSLLTATDTLKNELIQFDLKLLFKK
jgi:hypothetical protein